MSGEAMRRPAVSRVVAPMLLLMLLLSAGAAAWWLASDDPARLGGARSASGRTSSIDEPPDWAAFPEFDAVEPEREVEIATTDDDRPRYRDPPSSEPGPLFGRVRSLSGESVGAGVCILALLPSELGDLPQVERLRDGAVEERRAFTDDDGRFRFPVLPGGVLYRVMAGGRGFVSRSAGPACAAGDGELFVPVDAVYGLELRLVQQGGALLPTRCDFGPELLRPDARRGEEVLLKDRLRAVIAGARLEQLATDRRHRALLHVRRDAAGDSIGPWKFTLEEPGFLPRLEEIALPRMGDELAVRTFELRPVPGIRFGVLDVRLLGWPAEFERPAPDAPLGRITFDPPPQHGSDWVLDLRGRDLDGRRVEGVPEGRWPWTFHAASQYFSVYAMSGDEPLLVEVGAGTSELVIDLRDAGHLRLDAHFSTAGKTAASRSVLIVRRGGGQAVNRPVVDGRLELPFLRPGDYVAHARPQSLAADAVGRSRFVEFTITPGAVTRCELRVDD